MARQTKYKPEYCDQVIEMMAEGMDIKTVCLELRISRQSHYDWLETYPEYALAAEDGKFWAEGWHHEQGRKAMMGEIPNFMPGVWAQAGKNRFNLFDKVENKHTGEISWRTVLERANGGNGTTKSN